MEMTWAYIAGFFDGEGCLHAVGPGGAGKGRFRVTIAQADDIGKVTLTEIAQFLNGQGIYAYVCAHKNAKSRRKNSYRPVWNLWITQQRSIAKFIEGVFPYLRIKKQRAEDYRRTVLLTPNQSGLHNESQIKLRRDVLTRLLESGKSVSEIAKIHGLDYSTVWQKAKLMGFLKSSITPARELPGRPGFLNKSHDVTSVLPRGY